MPLKTFASATIVTDPMSDEQVTTVKDHLKEFPGFEVITSWDRKVVDSPMASIVGSVSTEQAGLPAEEVDDYLEKGDALNDRVGTSYLEKQYESVLQGERVEKKSIWTRMAMSKRSKPSLKEARETISSFPLIWISKEEWKTS